MPWKVTEIVEEVAERTEHRADEKIDLRMEFFLGLDEFVSERHFWWAKRRLTFNSVVGKQIYDLSLSSPSSDGSIQAGGGITDFAQFDELILLNADGQTRQLDCVPIIDPVAQLAAINNTTPDTPSAYFIDPQTSLTTLYFQAPANVAQKVLGTYWAIPQVTDTTQENIPLVPGHAQWGLIYMLEKRVYEFLYGQDDPRFMMASGRYQEFIKKASRIPHWSAKRVREMSVGGGVIETARAWGGT